MLTPILERGEIFASEIGGSHFWPKRRKKNDSISAYHQPLRNVIMNAPGHMATGGRCDSPALPRGHASQLTRDGRAKRTCKGGLSLKSRGG